MLPLEILTNPYAVLSIVVSLVILSLPIIPQEVNETYYTSEPLSYEKTSSVKFVNTTQPCFPKIICSVTEAHQSIKNTDSITGKFYLNFIFDNGIEKKSKTESINLLPSEEKEVSTDVPLSGQVNVDMNVIPPQKTIPHTRVIEKHVSAWSMLFLFRWLKVS